MEIDFISLFERSAYRNTYIYNLVSFFLRCVYFHLTTGASTNNVILLFDHYLQANSEFYTIYIDAGLYITSQKLCK